MIESCDQLSHEADLDLTYCRLRALPFSADLDDFIDRCERVYVVEQNRDAQMLSLMRMELSPERVAKL